jgi:hypothetical protein
MEHNRYHNKILEVLTAMIEPGWKVLDIGAGNGVLSLPLCATGCQVTAIEPSSGMRSLLLEEAMRRGIDWIKIDDRRWEDAACSRYGDHDLVIACNTLHLTRQGFERSLVDAFRTGAKNVFVVTEHMPGVKIPWAHNRYSMFFTKSYETESSFFYHEMGEVWEHHRYKSGGRPLSAHEEEAIRSRLVFEDDHICMKDTARVGMYWWQQTEGKEA